jgi:ESCRT-I complex subunit TSG101
MWITLEYPREPPIVYVVPTSDMLVKAGKFVDISGKCQFEYMEHWARKSEVRSV